LKSSGDEQWPHPSGAASNHGEMMNKTKLIIDNLKKLDDVLSGAGHWDYNDLVELLAVRSRFVVDTCSLIDCKAAQAGQYSQCVDKEAMAEIIYQRTLSVAIEKARDKAEIRREELPAAIFGKCSGGKMLVSCPGSSPPTKGWCYSTCRHLAARRGNAVYCRYPEKGR
jgi:hypothetical protein